MRVRMQARSGFRGCGIELGFFVLIKDTCGPVPLSSPPYYPLVSTGEPLLWRNIFRKLILKPAEIAPSCTCECVE